MDRRIFIPSWLGIMATRHSPLDISYWARQFRLGRESAEDSNRSRRPADFETHFRIDEALEAPPNASVRDIAQTAGIAPTTAFYVPTQVFHLEFRNWRWVPAN
jgi:hypothetical protein